MINKTDSKEKRNRIDVGLPLDLKFNSQIEISKTPFMLSEKMLIESPIDDNHIVTGIGKICFSDKEFYKFYLEELKNPQNKSILQVSTVGSSLSLVDFMFFKPYETLDLDENIISVFLDEKDGLIGLKDFIITTEDQKKFVYNRISPLPDKGGRHNTKINEKLIYDPFGDTGGRMESVQAMYSRDLGDDMGNEYCLVSSVKLLNLEGGFYVGNQEVYISILLGIELHKTQIK
jgi:hypothetical protein